MSRSKIFLEIMTRLWPMGNFGKKMARLPVLDRLIGPVLWNKYNMDATCVPVGEEIETPGGSFVPYQIIEELIGRASNRFIMSRCICRASLGCDRYPDSIGCIFLGDGVIEINPELGRRAEVEESVEHLHLATNHGYLQVV